MQSRWRDGEAEALVEHYARADVDPKFRTRWFFTYAA